MTTQMRVLNHNARLSRTPTWNNTYNCPYFGLFKIREKETKAINHPLRDEMIVRYRMNDHNAQV